MTDSSFSQPTSTTMTDPRIDLDPPADEVIENDADRLIDRDPIAENPPTDPGAAGIDLDAEVDE